MVSLLTPTLTTAHLTLRPLRADDAGDLFALHADAEALRYWDAPPWRESSRADAFLDTARRLAAEGTGVRVAVERSADRRFLGWCGVSRWSTRHRSAALTLCLDPGNGSRGFATEAARALLDWAFATGELDRVQAEADTRNLACHRVLEKLGFVHEGTLREDCVVEGVVSDTAVYGLLRREWP